MRKLRLEINNDCNYNCIFCHHDNFYDNCNKILNSSDYEFLTKISKKCGIKKIVLSGGEPLLRNDINEIINAIQKNNLYLQITTNGYHLDKLNCFDKINGLNISLHSTDLQTHEKITQTKFTMPKVLENISNLSKNQNLYIKLNIVALKDITISDSNIRKLLNFCVDNNITLKIIELLNKNDINFVESETIENIFINYGFKIKKRYRNNTHLSNEIANVIIQKCFCNFAKKQKNPTLFCNKNNDIFIMPSGKIKLCRFNNNTIDIYDLIKNRNENSLLEIFKNLNNSLKNKCKNT